MSSTDDYTPEGPQVFSRLALTLAGLGLAYKYHGGPAWKLPQGLFFLGLSVLAANGYEMLGSTTFYQAKIINQHEERAF